MKMGMDNIYRNSCLLGEFFEREMPAYDNKA